MNEQHRTIAPADPATMTMEERLADTLALVQGGNYADATAEERHQIISDLVEAMSDEEVRAIGAKVEAQAGRKRTAPGSRPYLFSTTINPVALAGLSLRHLSDLYSACRTLLDVAADIGCKPYFQDSQQAHIFNRAGEQADLFHELAAHCIDAVVSGAAKRVPADHGEALGRAWLLIRNEANLSDDLTVLADLAARETATIAEFEAQESAR